MKSFTVWPHSAKLFGSHFLLVLLCVVMAGGAAYVSARGIVTSHAADELTAHADYLAEDVAGNFARLTEEMVWFTESPIFEQYMVHHNQEHLADLFVKQPGHFKTFAFLAPDGRTEVHMRGQSFREEEFSDPTLFALAMAAHGMVHASLPPSEAGGGRRIRFALGVKTYFDEPVGVFMAEAPVAALAELLSRTRVGGTGWALLVTSDGTLLAASGLDSSAEAFTGQGDDWETFQAEVAGNRKAHGAFRFNGVDVLAIALPAGARDWSVVTLLPQEHVTAKINSISRSVVLAGLAALVLGLAVSRLLSRAVVTPVRDLADAARRVSGGDFSQPVPVRSGDELGVLADSFNHMTERLKVAYRDLRGSLRRTQRVVDTLREAVFVLGPDGDIRSANLAAGRMLRHRPEDFVGLPLSGFFPRTAASRGPWRRVA